MNSVGQKYLKIKIRKKGVFNTLLSGNGLNKRTVFRLPEGQKAAKKKPAIGKGAVIRYRKGRKSISAQEFKENVKKTGDSKGERS